MHIDALSPSFNALSLSSLSQMMLGRSPQQRTKAIFHPLEVELFNNTLNIASVSLYPTCQVLPSITLFMCGNAHFYIFTENASIW